MNQRVDAGDLAKQNAAPSFLVEASIRTGWNANELCFELFQSAGWSSRLSPEYTALLAKHVLSSLQDRLEADSLELVMQTLSTAYGAAPHQFCWVCYGNTWCRVLNPHVPLDSSLGDAQIGCRLWEAEVCVLEYLEANPHFVRNKSVLELGCGVGLAGIACIKLGATQVTLTDANSKVLENTQFCVDANCKDNSVSVAALEWSDPHGADKFPVHQVILAPDCVYDPHDVPMFVQTTMGLLHKGGEHSQALIASSIRNPATFSVLLEQLDRIPNLSYERFSIHEPEQAGESRYCNNTTHMLTKNWSRESVAMIKLQIKPPHQY